MLVAVRLCINYCHQSAVKPPNNSDKLQKMMEISVLVLMIKQGLLLHKVMLILLVGSCVALWFGLMLSVLCPFANRQWQLLNR